MQHSKLLNPIKAIIAHSEHMLCIKRLHLFIFMSQKYCSISGTWTAFNKCLLNKCMTTWMPENSRSYRKIWMM